MKRILILLFTLFVLVVMACGDHVVIPADKTGKCVAGLLTKCGETCVDLQTDINNCGGCMAACSGAKVCVAGKCADACPPGSTRCGDKCVSTDVDRTNCGMCGKTCAANEVCAKGKCGASCEAAGYLTCNGAMTGMFDAGGAMNCVNPMTDQNNCGACAKACMGGETCSDGLCCASGLSNCGGTCLDTTSDPNNCGTCGLKCPMANPTCVGGACSKCNTNILVIADNQTAINTQMKKVLQQAGFNPTVIDNGWVTYTGMPAATGFGAVLVFPGANFGSDMPQQGQQALIAAQQAGVGIVVDGFISYNVQQGRFQTAKALNLLAYQVTTITNQTLNANIFLPWFYQTPGSFGQVNYTLWFCGIITGGSQFAQINTGGPVCNGVTTWPVGVFKPSPSRIVQLNYGLSYNGAGNQWTNDNNLNQWVINGIRYAAGCTN